MHQPRQYNSSEHMDYIWPTSRESTSEEVKLKLNQIKVLRGPETCSTTTDESRVPEFCCLMPDPTKQG